MKLQPIGLKKLWGFNMKRRFLILLLILVLIPGGLVFVGCGNQNGYNISNLDKDFYAIAEENYFIVKTNNELIVDYGKYQNNGKEILNTLINAEAYQYRYIKDYDKLLHNILDFTFEYIDICSTYNNSVDKNLRNKTETDLNALKRAFADFNYSLDSFGDAVASNAHLSNPINDVNISKFKSTLNKYEDLLEASIKFSEDIFKIYYTSLNDANPNFLENKAEFKASMVINRIENRAKFQTNNLTRLFVEKYIVDEDLEAKIAKNENNHIFTTAEYQNYLQAVRKINSRVKVETAEENANANENFFELSVQMYNAQEILNNDYDKFVAACNKIDYQEVKNKKDKTEMEEMCLKIIDDYDYLVTEYNTILIQLINIMLGV